MKEIVNWTGNVVYAKNFFYMFIGNYIGYLACEIITIMVGLTKDIPLMAAWTSNFLILVINWMIGSGFSQVMRTDASIKIGENKPFLAKKYFEIGIVLGLGYAAASGIFVLCFYESIARC